MLVAVFVLAVGAPVALARATRGTAQYGVTVAGRDVSGMTRGQIAADVEVRARDVSVSVTVGGRTTRAGLAEAGVRVDAGATADAALAGSGSVRAIHWCAPLRHFRPRSSGSPCPLLAPALALVHPKYYQNTRPPADMIVFRG